MTRKDNIFKMIANAAIFILLEVAALSMLMHNSQMQNLWISKGIHTFMASVWGGAQDIKYYFSLKKENDRLALKNYELEQAVRMYESRTGMKLLQENMPEDIGKFRYTPAQIVKSSNNKQHNYLIIDKGLDDGITEQTGVITQYGVIGIIDAVGENYSFARSFQNSGMVVSARIGHSGATGSISWDGASSNGAKMSEVPQHIEFEKGDTVYTSGFSSIFPPDIPLGTVGEARIENGATYEIRVKLFEDFKSLRYVTLVNNKGKEEISELEKK